LFKYLVDETLAGREDKLKGYTIAIEVFNKENDFDADQNPYVRIHAGRLRRMLSIYYLRSGKNDPIRIEIPKGRYVTKFISNMPEEDNVISQKTSSENILKPTVAILPFANHSGDQAKDYFSLGFSEELSVELTKLEDLIVFDSMSFLCDSDSETDKYKDILKQGIRFIIEGSIQLTGNQIKVLVRLTDLNKGEQIWAERYLRDLSAANLIKIQESIISEISGILGSEYGIILQTLSNDIVHQKPRKLETFHAISRFYYFEANHTPEAAVAAFESLEHAIINEPDSGIAHAMLAALYGNRYTLDLQNAEYALKKTNELAETAIGLEPNCLTVRVIYAWKFFINNNKERFLKEVEKCLSKNPSISMRLGALGFYLCLFGEWDRGKAILDKVMYSNISFPHYYYGASTLYYYRRKDYEKALNEVLHYNIPTLFWGPMLKVAVLGQLGRQDEVKPHLHHLKQLKPDFESKATYLIGLWVKENDLVVHIMDGLRKAGMKI
jgi:TolB-like protein